MAMSNEEHRKNTKFIVDVSNLSTEAKLEVWKHFWDFGKSENPDFSIYHFNTDNYFSVYSRSDFRGNISRSHEHPAKFYGDELYARTFKPIVQAETVYHVIGLDAPEEIDIAGIKYRRVS